MENKPKFGVDSKERKLYFNGDYIKLHENLNTEETGTFDVNKKTGEKGIRLNYENKNYFDLNGEVYRVNNFVKEKGLSKILNLMPYIFPNPVIYITKKI